jgi:Ca-activated chloride channel family protein
MIPQDLHYGFFQGYILMFTVFLLGGCFWYLYNYRKKTLLMYSSTENLNKLMIPRSKIIYFLKALAFCLSWVLICYAFMQPEGNGYYPGAIKNADIDVLKLKPHDIIFMIDASASMSVKDTLSGKTRLELAKEIADEILSVLQGENAALYAFTSTATKMSPPTPDIFFVRMMLRDLELNEGGITGTDFKKSLEKIAQKHFTEAPEKLTTLIILSDGEDTHIQTLPDAEKAQATEDILKIFGDPEALNLRTFTIGMGSTKEEVIQGILYAGKPVYTKLNEGLLKLLSSKGRGTYFNSNTESAIVISREIFKKFEEDNLFLKESNKKEDPKKLLIYQLYFQVPLGISLLLLSFYIFFPDVSLFSKTKLVLIVISLSHMTLQASTADGLKKADLYFQSEDYKTSEKIYKELLKEPLDPFQKAVVLYNEGTALLFANNLAQAINTFESISLKGSPPPFLTRAIKTNLSIARFRQALELISSQQPGPDLLFTAITYLKMSERDIMLAEKAECDLQMLEGYAVCSIPESLKALKIAVKGNLSKLLKDKKNDVLNQKNSFTGSLDTLLGLFAQNSSNQLFDDSLLFEIQTSLNQIIKLSKDTDTIVILKRADELLQLSTNSDETLAKIYYEAAFQKIRSLVSVNDLDSILKKMIDEQEHTLIMTRLSRDLNKSRQVLQVLQESQGETIDVANSYLKEVYKQQEVFYKTAVCQKKPWNEILPLYNKGYQAAVSAERLLDVNLIQSADNQEDAIKYWKEILRKKEATKETEELKSDQEHTSEKALQLLQEMQQRAPLQKKLKTIIPLEGARPW